MAGACLTRKSPERNSKARLPPKRGQVKVGIFRWVAKKVACIASMARLGRKSSSVPGEPASATPLEITTCSLAKQDSLSRSSDPMNV